MMNKFYFSIGLIIILVQLKAQEKEYIIFHKNDTSYGEVRLPKSFGKPIYRDFIYFKENKDTVEKKYYTNEIQCFVESGDKYLNYDNQIIKLIDSGRINLYECMVIINNSHKNEDSLLNETTMKIHKIKMYRRYCLIMEDEVPTIIKKNKFSEICPKYFSDNFIISDRISRGVYKYKDLPQIVKAYNKDF